MSKFCNKNLAPTDKMINFAKIIAEMLNINLPDLTSYQSTYQFIKDNSPGYWETVTPYTELITKQNIEKIKNDYSTINIKFNEKFLEDIKKVNNTNGVYILWSGINLVYIGKSLNLRTRIISSIYERNTEDMPITSVSFIVTEATADMHILEPLLISEFKPILNTEFKCNDYSNHFKSGIERAELFKHRIPIIENEIDYCKNDTF